MTQWNTKDNKRIGVQNKLTQIEAKDSHEAKHHCSNHNQDNHINYVEWLPTCNTKHFVDYFPTHMTMSINEYLKHFLNQLKDKLKYTGNPPLMKFFVIGTR